MLDYKGTAITAVEVYELTTKGGATDFARLIAAGEEFGPYCLIGGLAVNCYVEPVYTMDADLVVVSSNLPKLCEQDDGFKVENHPHSLNACAPGSDLRIQFSIVDRYQNFLSRSIEAEVLEMRTKVASLKDVAQGKLWAYGDPSRRLSKRKKEELDLIRLAEVYTELRSLYPPQELRDQLDRG